MTAHDGRLVALDDPRRFRADCSCGWQSKTEPTNAVMGRHRRHVAAHRRKDQARS